MARRSNRKELSGATMSRVFLDVGPDVSETVILGALAFRNEASESVRSSLNAAIDNQVKMVGFRHPSRANESQLKEPTLYQLIAKSNDKLAGALLRAWVESEERLRCAMESRLQDVDVPADAPDFKVGRFNSKWDVGEWRKMKDALAKEYCPEDARKAALMVMCVSGKSHEISDDPHVLSTDMLAGWMEQLEELPPDAPEWEECFVFADMVSDMADRKSAERREFEVDAVNQTVAAIKSEFGEELRYLEINLSAWTGANAKAKNAETEAKDLANGLRDRLAEYRPLRPQGESRAEEAERSAKRDEAEKAILDLVPKWGELEGAPFTVSELAAAARRVKAEGGDAARTEPPPGSPLFAEMAHLRKMRDDLDDIRKATDELSSDQSKEDIKYILQSHKEMKGKIERLESDNTELKRANSDLKSLNDGIADENASLKQSNAALSAEKAERDAVDAAALEAEVGRLQADNRRLAEEKEGLERDNEGLRADKELLGQEKDEMQLEAMQSRETETYWREAYIAASAGQTRAALGASPDDELGSVNEALDLAQTMFPNELAIALNSKSTKNSPFRKPDEVFGALSWLATEYRRNRMRSAPGAPRPDFNRLLKESCPGWFYKPGQTEVTTEQFIQWYTTTVDNKTYELYHHIGKGNSHDPQHTIRIAFAWDDERERVAVGFLGLHQRNRRS